MGPSAGADGPLCAVGLAETGKPVPVALRADVARRMAIAEIVARVFPAHRKLVRDVEALFPELTKRWARRPYPADRLTYLSDRALRYRTPGHAEGLGTQGSLGKGTGDVDGYVALRLPEAMRSLVGPILDDAARR